ncbi:hypothetical protein GOV07_01665 [Candidatus Woesearchaeota archaeon]|nr:hypothetical protein [Candidatus Woesearchaeota archaeon]
MDIPPEQQFHFRDGESISDLEGLKGKIESIGYEEFYGHVNDEKNDFAAWVEGVLQDTELANRLRAVTSIVETVEMLNEALYPEDTQVAETALESSGETDFQQRIEEQLFSEEPKHVDNLEGDTDFSSEGDEVSLPTPEEVQGERLPGAPVTTADEAHTPITERVDRPVSHEEHMKFVVKQFIYGFLLGIIIGYVLANIIGRFI